jgi:hypothetical protein
MVVSLSANVRNRRKRRDTRTDREGPQSGRVGMWRGGVRSTMSVAAPFVWVP